MSLFKIKITPIEKDRDWGIKLIGSGRIKKTCQHCKKEIKQGEPSVTFTKITSVGSKKKFETYHTCRFPASVNTDQSVCTQELCAKLNIDYKSSLDN